MNKYEVLGIVGEGAYGVVLKCRNKESEEIVAIKRFKEADDDEILRKTTLREVKILRLLRHSNIVSLTEAFRRKGKLYLVFEYVEKNLLEVLEEQPQGLRAEVVRMYVHQLCEAIHWCHSHDVIHRDIKPENLLINGKTKLLKLCDFGFARIVTKSTNELTDYVATRWYRAPELLLGSTGYGFEVDIWAIGCIMGEITDGQPIFPGETEVDQLYIVQRVLGPLIPAHVDLFTANPRFLGLKFPDMSKPETLQKKYVGKLGKSALNFLQSVLRMDPAERPSSEAALAHTYFDEIRGSNAHRGVAVGQEKTAVASNASNGALARVQHPSPRVSQPPDQAARSRKNDPSSLPNPSNKPSSKEASRGSLNSRAENRSRKTPSGTVEAGGRRQHGTKGIDPDGPSANQHQPEQQSYSDSSNGANPHLNMPIMAPDLATNSSSVSQHQISSYGPSAPPVNMPSDNDNPGLRAETPVGNPPSRQIGRRSRAGPGAPPSTADRERERARELEREVERERERQREVEMKSFREFSTKLPIVLRAPTARSAVLGGGLEAHAANGNIYDNAAASGGIYSNGSGIGIGLMPLKYDSQPVGGAPPSSVHSMGRIAPLDRSGKEPPPVALPSSRQSSRQGNRQPQPTGPQQSQGTGGFYAQQDFNARLTTVNGSISGESHYAGGYTGASPPPGYSGGYTQSGHALGGGNYYNQTSSGLGAIPPASYRQNNFPASLAVSHLPHLQYNASNEGATSNSSNSFSNSGVPVMYSNAGVGGWDGDETFMNSGADYSLPNGSNPLKYLAHETVASVSPPRVHGPGGHASNGLVPHRTQKHHVAPIGKA